MEVWGLADFLRFRERAKGLAGKHTWTMGSAGSAGVLISNVVCSSAT